MRTAYAALSSLLLLGGCATFGMGPHAQHQHMMENCPMASAHAVGAEHGQPSEAGHPASPDAHPSDGQNMQHGAMAHCPMASHGATAAPPGAPPADPHQH